MGFKKFLMMFTIICFLIAFFPMSKPFNVTANNGVEQKISELEKLFPTGSYFTTTGTNSCNKNIVYGSNYSYCYSSSCPTCRLGNVLELNLKAKNTIVPNICLRPGRYSCYGFAVFAFCYIFEHDPDINVTTISSDNYGGINNDFLRKLKPGDLIECDNGSHYAIFLKYDSNYLYLYESNYDSPNQVEYNHKRTWNRWSVIKAYRSNFYGKISSGDTSSETTVKDYYKLTSPDGYQTVRAEANTSSASVGKLNTGDIVCVTKYNSDRTWGYITSGNISGWIRLYYVEATNPPSDYYLLTSPDGYQTVRSEATTSSASVGTLYKGDIVYVIKYNSDRTWGYIDNGVISGWIMLYYIEPTTHSHSYNSWTTTKNATCTDTGTQTRKCKSCSTTQTQAIPATGHINYGYRWLYEPTENGNGKYVKYCYDCNTDMNLYDIPHIKIESIVFTENTIECRILKPSIDPELSYFISPIPITEQNDEISVLLSDDDRCNVYTIKDVALLKERENFKLELWFGAGKITYDVYVFETLNCNFNNIASDINGDFLNDADDLILLRKVLLGLENAKTGDANADGKINVKDLVGLKKHLSQ